MKTMQHHTRLITTTKLLGIALLIALLPSCSVTDNVVSQHTSDQSAHSKHLAHIGKTHWSYFWGIYKPQGTEWNAGCQQGSNLSRVRVTTNPGFIIVSIVTLGIAVPQKLEWDCSPPCRTTGQLP